MVSLLGRSDCFSFFCKISEQESNSTAGFGGSSHTLSVPLLKEILELESKFHAMNYEYERILEARKFFPGEIGSEFCETKLKMLVHTPEHGASGDCLLQHLNKHLSCALRYDPNCLPELKAQLEATLQQNLCTAISDTDSGRNLLIEVILPISIEDFSDVWFKDRVNASLSTYPHASEFAITIQDSSAITTKYTKEGTRKGRVLKSLQELVNNDDARAAALRIDELIAAYMYTGPMYQVSFELCHRAYSTSSTFVSAGGLTDSDTLAG
jgi:hypothetical protein